jgi:hypothetical protein
MSRQPPKPAARSVLPYVVHWIQFLLRRRPGRTGEHVPERRRAQRVSAAIPVLLYGRLGDEPVHENTETVDVSEYGGLVTVSMNFAYSQTLILTNAQTNQDLPCRVARLFQSEKHETLAGLEFFRHSPSFWDSATENRAALR